MVGFGIAKSSFMFSRLMALDAEIMGTWGCLPSYYRDVLKMVQAGTIRIDPLVDLRPMSTIRQAFEEAHSQSPMKRLVLTNDF